MSHRQSASIGDWKAILYGKKQYLKIMEESGLSLCIETDKNAYSSLNINANTKTTIQEVTRAYRLANKGFKLHKLENSNFGHSIIGWKCWVCIQKTICLKYNHTFTGDILVAFGGLRLNYHCKYMGFTVMGFTVAIFAAIFLNKLLW